jgi:arsenate reductase (glutaredoxin)
MQSKGAAMIVTLFHNPRCSKSRATLALLQERGIEPDIRLYLEDPPDAAEIRRLLDQLGLEARELVRKGEQAFREQGLGDPGLSDAQLIAAMAATPKLIERPIVIANGKAKLGRPPESVLEIL